MEAIRDQVEEEATGVGAMGGGEGVEYSDIHLRPPYSYFGGKSKISPAIWNALGNVPNFIDPFFGSNAILLARPTRHLRSASPRIETVNDADGMLCNFWRAVRSDPGAVAHYADNPTNENDYHARHAWLVGQRSSLQSRLEGDPEFFDTKIAGWWVWGVSLQIGAGFASGGGPWLPIDGELVRVGPGAGDGTGINHGLPSLGSIGGGINRRLLGPDNSLSDPQTTASRHMSVHSYILYLSERMRFVRVACGDWRRVVTSAITSVRTPCAIILDPPFSGEGRSTVYTHDSSNLCEEVWAWAMEHGDNPDLRLVLFGYDLQMPDWWRGYRWTNPSGYGHGYSRAEDNRARESIWFSPSCRPIDHRPDVWRV